MDPELITKFETETGINVEYTEYESNEQMLAQIDGVGYVARGAVNDAGNVARTKRMMVDAFTAQQQGLGLSFVEVLTMCPTGWFIPTDEAPDYLAETIAGTHAVGVLRSELP